MTTVSTVSFPTVKLVRNTLTKQIVSAHAVAPVSLAAHFVVEDKPVYGPTEFNRFIVDGRYVSVEVRDMIWEAVSQGAGHAAVKVERAKRTRTRKVGALLTVLETTVFDALKKSNEGNGGDFFLVEEARGVVAVDALGGVISSLVKKGVIEVCEAVTTDSGTWTQGRVKA